MVHYKLVHNVILEEQSYKTQETGTTSCENTNIRSTVDNKIFYAFCNVRLSIFIALSLWFLSLIVIILLRCTKVGVTFFYPYIKISCISCILNCFVLYYYNIRSPNWNIDRNWKEIGMGVIYLFVCFMWLNQLIEIRSNLDIVLSDPIAFINKVEI